jgi:hypothetical protein
LQAAPGSCASDGLLLKSIEIFVWLIRIEIVSPVLVFAIGVVVMDIGLGIGVLQGIAVHIGSFDVAARAAAYRAFNELDRALQQFAAGKPNEGNICGELACYRLSLEILCDILPGKRPNEDHHRAYLLAATLALQEDSCLGTYIGGTRSAVTHLEPIYARDKWEAARLMLVEQFANFRQRTSTSPAS